jgi:hypothetical protein
VKKRVPPSPGIRQHSRRDQALACPFLDQEAVEENDDGVSQTGSCNSRDDRHLPNLSDVTDGTCAQKHSKFNIVT